MNNLKLTFARRTSAEAVQDLAASDTAKAVSYAIRVNGAPVAFAKGMGEPVKPDDNTGVCCAYEPVLAALKAAGAELEYVVEPKRIPADKKWLRKLSPTPFVGKKNQKVVCGELAALVGYIPGVEIKADAKARVVDLKVAK